MCKVKHCKRKDIEIYYKGKEVCARCWELHAAEKIKLDEVLN